MLKLMLLVAAVGVGVVLVYPSVTSAHDDPIVPLNPARAANSQPELDMSRDKRETYPGTFTNARRFLSHLRSLMDDYLSGSDRRSQNAGSRSPHGSGLRSRNTISSYGSGLSSSNSRSANYDSAPSSETDMEAFYWEFLAEGTKTYNEEIEAGNNASELAEVLGTTLFLMFKERIIDSPPDGPRRF